MIYRFLIGLTIVLLQRGRFRQERFDAIYRPLVKSPEYGRPYLLCSWAGGVGLLGGYAVALAVDPAWLGVGLSILAVVAAGIGLGHFEKKAIERYARVAPDEWRPPDAATIRDVLRKKPDAAGDED
jgi:hypothetical protein